MEAVAGIKRQGSAVLHRSPRHRYPVAVAAAGMRIADSNGRQYLDMSGGAAVSCLGHAHPDVILALRQQLETLAFAHTAFLTNEPQEQLALNLAERFGDDAAHVYFLTGGSEATEAALKIAWQYWAGRGKPDKKVIISREHSYHGNTLGALSASGNAGRRHASAAPLIDWPRIAPCYEYRELRTGETLDEYARRAADYLSTSIRMHGSDQIAAFIAEPVVGSSLGMVPAVSDYFERIRRICDENEVLLIADEIMCGSGRTGTYFAHEQENFRPDIVTLAKGIGGGYQPLAAVVISGHVNSALAAAGFAHGHTYVGHAIACAAGLAVLGVIEREDLLSRTQRLGNALAEILAHEYADHPYVGDIRCRGLFAGIELVSNRDTRAGFENGDRLADELRSAAMDHGLICYPSSITVDNRTVPHVMLAPPMIAEERHLEEGIAKLTAAIDATLHR